MDAPSTELLCLCNFFSHDEQSYKMADILQPKILRNARSRARRLTHVTSSYQVPNAFSYYQCWWLLQIMCQGFDSGLRFLWHTQYVIQAYQMKKSWCTEYVIVAVEGVPHRYPMHPKVPVKSLGICSTCDVITINWVRPHLSLSCGGGRDLSNDTCTGFIGLNGI